LTVFKKKIPIMGVATTNDITIAGWVDGDGSSKTFALKERDKNWSNIRDVIYVLSLQDQTETCIKCKLTFTI